MAKGYIVKSTKTLGRPVNWQDFESLCKKLWGEIWQCAEITKHGRNGNNQHGVDIYGVPAGEVDYFGIQCKGKDEYTNQELTESEINAEIEKAKSFEPPLKKLYFTTTAVKNAKIEAFIRKKNIEHKSEGIFEVHLFSWEDIVDFIYENQSTYNYYVNSINFKSSQSVEVTFQNGSNEIWLDVKFLRRITEFRQKAVPRHDVPLIEAINNIHKANKILEVKMYGSEPTINYSMAPLSLKIKNTGSSTLEKFKLYFAFSEGLESITYSNVNDRSLISGFSMYTPDISFNQDTPEVTLLPHINSLVGDDQYQSNDFYVKPSPKTKKIRIEWKLLANEFSSTGELFIHFNSEIITEIMEHFVTDPFELKAPIEHMIEDYVVPIER